MLLLTDVEISSVFHKSEEVSYIINELEEKSILLEILKYTKQFKADIEATMERMNFEFNLKS